MQQQRKIKSSLTRRDPGDLLSPKLVSLFAILLSAFFIIYILVFHAILHQKSDEPVTISVAAPVTVPVGVSNSKKGAANTPLTKQKDQQHAAVPVHDKKKAQPLPISKQVRERKVVETKHTYAGSETLILKTAEGDIKISLLPDLSKESIDYIRAMVVDAGNCSPCNLYRAEKPGILQGVLTNKRIPIPTIKGTCPRGSEGVPNDCPDWDKSCGCHGPVLTKGMVAWAAGATGPDFFISNYEKPALFWGTQHTACTSFIQSFIHSLYNLFLLFVSHWQSLLLDLLLIGGEIQDEESLKTVSHIIMDLPAKHHGGLTFLKKQLHIDIALKRE
jgi:hypothetical protein